MSASVPAAAAVALSVVVSSATRSTSVVARLRVVVPVIKVTLAAKALLLAPSTRLVLVTAEAVRTTLAEFLAPLVRVVAAS